MSQTEHLVATLKRLLKARGVTYRQVAGHLGLSEPSVKRQFSRLSLRSAMAQGRAFFERAIELQKKHGGGKTIDNSFQTNGTLRTTRG